MAPQQLGYQNPSSCFYGDHILQSEEGVQEEDLLGSFCFASPSIDPLFSNLISEFKVFYFA